MGGVGLNKPMYLKVTDKMKRFPLLKKKKKKKHVMIGIFFLFTLMEILKKREGIKIPSFVSHNRFFLTFRISWRRYPSIDTSVEFNTSHLVIQMRSDAPTFISQMNS